MKKIVFYLALSLASSNIFALEIKCPKEITTHQSLVEPVADWQEFVRPSFSDQNSKLSHFYRIDLYAGDPKEIAQLKPDDENAINHTWSFSEPAPAKIPIYMSCVYHDTRIEVIKALPLNVKECTVFADGVLRCKQFKS